MKPEIVPASTRDFHCHPVADASKAWVTRLEAPLTSDNETSTMAEVAIIR